MWKVEFSVVVISLNFLAFVVKDYRILGFGVLFEVVCRNAQATLDLW